jgi:hypothetical protein
MELESWLVGWLVRKILNWENLTVSLILELYNDATSSVKAYDIQHQDHCM